MKVSVTQGLETCCLRTPVLLRACLFKLGRRVAPPSSAPRLNGEVAVILAVWRLESGKGPREFLGRGSLMGK